MSKYDGTAELRIARSRPLLAGCVGMPLTLAGKDSKHTDVGGKDGVVQGFTCRLLNLLAFALVDHTAFHWIGLEAAKEEEYTCGSATRCADGATYCGPMHGPTVRR